MPAKRSKAKARSAPPPAAPSTDELMAAAEVTRRRNEELVRQLKQVGIEIAEAQAKMAERAARRWWG